MAFALLVPSVPLSDVKAAFADTVLSDDAAGQVSAAQDTSLDSDYPSRYDAGESVVGDTNDPSLGRQINRDMPFGGTLDASGVIQIDCANEQEGFDAHIEEYERQEAEKEAKAQECLAEEKERIQQTSPVDPLEAYKREQAELTGETVPEDRDASIPLDDFIVGTGEIESQTDDSISDEAATPSAAAAFSGGSVASAASAPTYSMVPVVADIKKLTLYERYRGSIPQDSFWVNSDGTPDMGRNYMLVECNRTPAFYAEIVGGYYLPYQGDKDTYGFNLYRYAVTLKLPSAEGEPAKTVDVVWGFKQNSPSSGYIGVGGTKGYPSLMPAVNDATILATFASVSGYDKARNTAYLNAYKLAPFSSAEDIVKSGNAVSTDSPLFNKTISETWPIHKDDGMKVSMVEADAPNIARCFVYFSDGTNIVQDVTYHRTKGLVASYTADSTGMLYQPNMWLIDSVAQKGVDDIASFIRSKTWNNWFAAWMKTKAASKNVTMHRVICDHFDQDMHENAEEVAANLMANIPSWSGTGANMRAWQDTVAAAKTAEPKDDWKNPDATEIKLFNLLFLYAYYEYLFSFDAGGSEEIGLRKDANLFLVTAFRGSVMRGGCSLVNMTPSVTSTKMDSYSYIHKQTEFGFPSTAAQWLGTSNPRSIVETFVRRTTSYQDLANWFADHMNSIAFFHEYEPVKIEGVSDNGQLLWRGWDQARRFPDQLLAWLTMPPGAQYFASTSMIIATGNVGAYQKDLSLTDENRAKFKGKIDAIFNKIRCYSPTLASLTGVNNINTICIENLEQLRSDIDGSGWGGTSYMEREALWGKKLTADPYHKRFSDAMDIYNGVRDGTGAKTLNVTREVKRIFYVAYKALDCNFDYYWSHEMTHAIDNDVFCGGETRCQPENYTDGLLTQQFGIDSYVMNLFATNSLSSDMASNTTVERVNTVEKLNDFYHKMYEARDLLEYASLKAFLNLSLEEQNAVSSQIWFNGQNGNSAADAGSQHMTVYPRQAIIDGYDGTNATMPVNAGVFNDGSKKFETPEEVYDNMIALRPGLSGATSWGQEIYVSDTWANMWWYPPHHNGSYSTSRTFKTLMYQFLGRNGFAAWRNFGKTGGTDLTKLQQASGCASYKEWQLGTWAEIESKQGQLSCVGFDDLVDKFESALKADAASGSRSLAQTNSLRQRMYLLMKRTTNDFRNGIYENQAPVTYIHNLSELQAIADDPFGNYALANDINANGSGVELSGFLVSGVFYGKLDGQGHKIFTDGELLPYVFQNMRHAYVKDLTIAGGVVMRPSYAATNSEWENLAYEVYSHEIHTVDDFLEVGELSAMGINVFTLMEDLDFTEWSAANANGERRRSVVDEAIVGSASQYKEFHSDGHVITGLHGASLFGNVAFVDFHNVTFKNCDNLQSTSSADGVAIVAAQAHKGRFWNLKFENVKVEGKYRVGFVVGNDGRIKADGTGSTDGFGSRFDRIQVSRGSMTVGGSGCYAGFVTGCASGSSISDVYVHGTLTTNAPHVGGVVGVIRGSAQLVRCISNVSIVRKGTGGGLGNNIGVLLGSVENLDASKTSVESCVGLGSPGTSQANGAGRLTRVDSLAALMTNCYENASQKFGYTLSGASDSTVGWVRTGDAVAVDNGGAAIDFSADVTDLRNNRDFYEALGFDDDLWDFGLTMQYGFPLLEVLDPDFYTYDLDIAIDYKNERMTFAGTDIKDFYTKLQGMACYYLNPPANSQYKPGAWIDMGGQNPVSSYLTAMECDGYIPVGDIIDDERFMNDEVREKGYRTVTLSRDKSRSGKYESFSKSVQLPVRAENPYADSLVGVRANSKGEGYIRLDAVGAYGTASLLEYRRVPAQQDSDGQLGGDATWIPMASTATPVDPGDYEVRVAGTEFTFASRPTTITVEEFDPDAVIFPLMLDPNGGEWTGGYTAPVEYNNEEETPLPTEREIVRAGHEFSGWYDNAECAGEPLTCIPAGHTDALELFAKWVPISYSVKLNFNGGALADPADNVVRYTHGTAEALPVPTRVNRTFLGWYDNPECDGEPISEIPANEIGDKEFWAKWEPILYKVVLNAEGGVFADGIEGTFRYELGEGAALPNETQITRVGYRFGGWFDNAQLVGNAVSSISAIDSGDKEYFAKWTPETYSVVLAGNGGVLAAGQVDVTSHTYGESTVLPRLERPGYHFGGWFDNELCSGEAIAAIPADSTGTKAFWAKWIPEVHAIVYHLGDYAGDRPPAIDLDSYGEYEVGSMMPLPDVSVMQWTDHVFAGWYDNENFDGLPLTEVPVDAHDTLFLYAKWLGDVYMVSYHTNGGTFVHAPKTEFEVGVDGFEVGGKVTLPTANDITRNGYRFMGWFTTAECSGAPLEDIMLDQRTVSLYAKWETEEYSISYDLQFASWVDGYEPPSTYTVESSDVLLPSVECLELNGYAFKGWLDYDGGAVVTRIPAGSFGDRRLQALLEGTGVRPAPSGADISSIGFEGFVVHDIAWTSADGACYAKIRVPRSKMPKNPEDFKSIVVPDGVEVVSVKKREATVVSAFVPAAREAVSMAASDIWDILLRFGGTDGEEVPYVLEIEPMDDGQAPPEGDDAPEQTPPEDTKLPDRLPVDSGDPPTSEEPQQPDQQTPQGSQQSSSGSEDGQGGASSGDATGGGVRLADTGDDALIRVMLSGTVALMGLVVALVAGVCMRRRSAACQGNKRR